MTKRKPKSKKQSHRVPVMMTETLSKSVARRAAKAEVSVSEWVRQAVKDKIFIDDMSEDTKGYCDPLVTGEANP